MALFTRQDSFMAAKGTSNETMIAHGVKVEGEFVSEGDVTIEGEVVGTLKTAQNLRVGESAKIAANVSAQSAVIAGEVHGNLTIGGLLELTASSRVFGDIETSILSIASGAVVNGQIRMGEQGASHKKGRTSSGGDQELAQ